MNALMIARPRLLGVAAGLFVFGVLVFGIMRAWLVPPPDTGTASLLDRFSSTDPSSAAEDIPETPAVPVALWANEVISLARGSVTDSVKFYERESGRVFQVSLATHAAATISGNALGAFVSSVWSPDAKRVASLFAQSTGMAWKTYDYETGRSERIGTSVRALTFSRDGSRIAFVDTRDGVTGIYAAGWDGSDERLLMTTRLRITSIVWPSDAYMALVTQQGSGTLSDVSLLYPGGKLVPIITNKRVIETAWSRDGTHLLYSFFTDEGQQVWSKDLVTMAEAYLTLSTSAAKCGWTPDSSSVVCGVPSDSLLPLDTYAASVTTNDDIIRIDVTSSVSRVIATHGKVPSVFSVEQLMVSDSGTYAAFINSFDHKPYVISVR